MHTRISSNWSRSGRVAVRQARQAVLRVPLVQAPHRLHTAGVCRAQKASDLPASLQKLVGAFQIVPDPMARYKQLLFFAAKLDVLPKEYQVPENKVEGCVSQVWVMPELRDDGKLYWRAESDSQLTKGLAALLVQGLSGCSAQEILRIEPDFIEMLGLKQSLTPSRNNGFLNMFKLMQRKAAVIANAESAAASSQASNQTAVSSSDATSDTASSSGSSSSSSTPIQDGMRQKLTSSLKPLKLVIEDESSQHAGHAAMRSAPGKAGSSGETHFKVEVVSEAFEGLNLVKRHRLIYSMLQDEFSMGLHALSLDTKTPTEAKV